MAWDKKEDHPDMNQEGNYYNWLPDFVYGGIDGVVTTFAVVAGVEGASLSVPIILILGFANLLADGFSMATSKYLSDKASLETFEKIRQIEFRHLKEKPDRERQEITEILEKYGLKGKVLQEATAQITANPEAWVDLMMRNEFNMTQENISPVKGAIATFTAFIVIGFIPLMGYTFRAFLPLSQSNIFWATCVFTLIALFIVGAVKSRFSIRSWFISGLETVFFGGIAASLAYLVGYLLKGLVL